MTPNEREKLEAVRDMFAGHIIHLFVKEIPKVAAEYSYDYADAMIEEKLKRQKQRDKYKSVNVDETKKELK